MSACNAPVTSPESWVRKPSNTSKCLYLARANSNIGTSAWNGLSHDLMMTHMYLKVLDTSGMHAAKIKPK
jgi:hypothetical protein